MTIKQQLYEQLGFKVENNQIVSLATRVNAFDKTVPRGVRPATPEEVKLWNALLHELRR